jgi:hypothetical protein
VPAFLQSLLSNPAAIAAVVGVLFLAWRNRVALAAALESASATKSPATRSGVVEVRELTDNEALLARRMEVLQGMRYDAADQPDETQRTADLKFLDLARDLARRLTPAEDVLPIGKAVTT